MSRTDDGSIVGKINEERRDVRGSLTRTFDNEDEQSALPLVAEPDGQRDQSWWEGTVQKLDPAIEKYKRTLREDDDSHTEPRLKLAAACDLLPERTDSDN